MPCRHRCWYEYYRPKDPDGKVGGGYTCGGICNEPLFHFSYDRLPDRFVGLSSLGGEEVFCRQCRTDGCFRLAGFLLFDSKVLLYVSIALVGYGNSNVFSILFSQALLSMPQRQNEVSGLMIMGLFGGTVFPLLMGFASDALHSQTGTLLVLVVGVFYLLFLFTKLR